MKAIQRTFLPTDLKQSLQSVREALNILGGKWRIPILVSLAAGEKRFKEIQYQTGITSKVLSRELKTLEANNLVVRMHDRKNNVVYYAATKKCESVQKVVEGLKEWGDYHRTNIFNRPIRTRSIPSFENEGRRESQ
jgi:DNA-binding HxlR family transcriptional regulator